MMPSIQMGRPRLCLGVQVCKVTLLEMDVMKLLTSSCVGQLFWQGASAHLRQRAASRRAARSLSVVCLMSSKSANSGRHV